MRARRRGWATRRPDRGGMLRIVLLKLTVDSMVDKPGADWHRRIRRMLDDLASASEIGGELVDVFWTLGPYDAVIQVNLPSDQAATAFALTASRKLRAQTTTLTAMHDEDMDAAMAYVHRKNGPRCRAPAVAALPGQPEFARGCAR